MRWQGRTGLLVGVALVVAAGLVLPAKKSEDCEPIAMDSEVPVAAAKAESPGVVPVSRPSREHAPGLKP